MATAGFFSPHSMQKTALTFTFLVGAADRLVAGVLVVGGMARVTAFFADTFDVVAARPETGLARFGEALDILDAFVVAGATAAAVATLPAAAGFFTPAAGFLIAATAFLADRAGTAVAISSSVGAASGTAVSSASRSPGDSSCRC